MKNKTLPIYIYIYILDSRIHISIWIQLKQAIQWFRISEMQLSSTFNSKEEMGTDNTKRKLKEFALKAHNT
jgi:hypothetical protein